MSYWTPTHWMPLPDPPSEAAIEAQPQDPLQKLKQVVHDKFRCMTCGTAAYIPNDRCKAHISCEDALQTEREMSAAWRKRAEEAEAAIEAVTPEKLT